jgi:hypothetical protein
MNIPVIPPLELISEDLTQLSEISNCSEAHPEMVNTSNADVNNAESFLINFYLSSPAPILICRGCKQNSMKVVISKLNVYGLKYAQASKTKQELQKRLIFKTFCDTPEVNETKPSSRGLM